MLLSSSVGLCVNAAGAPQGTALVSGFQTQGPGAGEPGPPSLPPDGRAGGSAEAELERHVADLVRLVLLTGPGERLHRAGLRRRAGGRGALRAARRRAPRAWSRCGRGARSRRRSATAIEVLDVAVDGDRGVDARRRRSATASARRAPRRRRRSALAVDRQLQPTCPPLRRPSAVRPGDDRARPARRAGRRVAGRDRLVRVWLYPRPARRARRRRACGRSRRRRRRPRWTSRPRRSTAARRPTSS